MPRLVNILGALVLFSGCQHLIALSDIEVVDEVVPTYRRLPSTDDSARLRATDLITLTPVNGTILVSASCGAGVPTCPAGSKWLPIGPVAQGRAVRIPVSTLSCMQWADLELTSASGVTKTGSVHLEAKSGEGSTCIAFSNEKWISGDELRQRISRSKLPLRVEIVRLASQKVLPGDRVDADLRFRIGPGEIIGAQPLQSAHASSVLDESGGIEIDAPGALASLPDPTSAQTRLAYALGSNANLGVRLWRPGRCSADQPALSDAAACLAASWTEEESPQRARLCASQMGIDSVQRNAGQANKDWSNASYQLRAVQSWTLVGDDQIAHIQPFDGPVSVNSAVSLAYRALYGRDLLRKKAHHKVFVTIVPSASRCAAERVPLSGVADFDKPSTLDRLALLPGDSVHVSYQPPSR
ncbi:MAG: hypothetical protein E5V46_01690 [Mesorhizobium sp.]|nr:MAG: hypothetical protein E5V46_01690 [Mesorhizobium sp.]